MRHLVALAGLTVGLLSPLTVTAPAYAVGESCEGLPATIVGSPGVMLKGTVGDDVIVSNGARYVFAGAGNDTICTTGSLPPAPDSSGYVGPAVVVEGEAGTNLVDRRGDLDPNAASLVFEANTFYGSEGKDVVTMTTQNVVATGGGDDFVFFALPGTVDLGTGDDTFVADGENGPTEPFPYQAAPDSPLTVVGGTGEDRLEMVVSRAGHWTFDVPRGRLSTRKATALAFGGFEEYESGSWRDDVRLDFVGSRRGETFELADASDSAVRSVRMGGGDDEILVFSCGGCSASQPGILDGGPGHDLLKAQDFNGYRTAIDLAAHRLVRSRDHRSFVTRLAAIEDVQAYSFRSVTVTGDGHDNDLRVWGCRTAVIRGGGGDDALYYLASFQFGPQRPEHPLETRCKGHVVNVVADGGAGRDLLVGGRGPDLLDGGSGRDTARAGQGTDRCPEVEVRKGCERR